ncbi:MYB DNA-binding domain protein [Lasiodiplodia theobromae]|uniref:Uncharacterized protein n=1 Tax=Lasiodiplodia theobromae TaxID=45133 RepID=A0A5N5D6Q8_9PEZI|nr:MYB DNA-binding domain protein [Lasiodiplodia theobromae]KAB2573024.1 hypothetical protein DBV05_g8323 [Lasiodiplodia theobromae]KAF4544480.1 MYB DNA-binding domain protein [Lasiodiplodia theobromae]
MAAAPESSASDSIYAQVDNYPWDTDTEFQSGLGAILGSTASSEQAVELSLRARCFYYSRKFNTSVDFDAYKAYRASAPSPSAVPTTAPNGLAPAADLPATPSPGQTPPLGSTATFPSAAPTTSTPASAPPPAASAEGEQQGEAPYPTSFAHIVELITSGQPIPGIKEIPDTVLEGQGSASTASKRKKPWEKDVGVAAGSPEAAAAASQ